MRLHHVLLALLCLAAVSSSAVSTGETVLLEDWFTSAKVEVSSTINSLEAKFLSKLQTASTSGERNLARAKAKKTPKPTKKPTQAPSLPRVGTVYSTGASDAKFLKVALTFDSAAVQQLGGAGVETRVRSIAKRLKQIFTSMTPIILTQVVSVTYWTPAQEASALQTSASTFLDDNNWLVAFNRWRAKTIEVDHTVGHLFTGLAMRSLVDDKVLAARRSACNRDMSSSMSSLQNQTSDDLIAKYAAHAIAHTIGIEHLNVFAGAAVTMQEAIACATDKTEIMQVGKVLDSNPRSATWSTCSRKWWSIFLDGFPAGCSDDDCVIPSAYDNAIERTQCMETPAQEDLFSMCGDGILDTKAGEECDCGDADQCKDKCCDAATCKLKPSAVCSSSDACCDPETCAPYNEGTKVVCRESAGSCDPAEMCDGKSKDCPADSVAPFATICVTESNLKGTCGDGVCQSQQDQCIDAFQNPLARQCPNAKVVQPCQRLSCLLPGMKSCVRVDDPMEDGTSCGTNRFCQAGKCILKSNLKARTG